MTIFKPDPSNRQLKAATRAERNEQAMSVAHLEHTLGKRTVQGGGLMVITHILKIIIQFISLAVLGRVLLPDDFGLVAMSWVVLAFISIFADLGLATATIQRKEIDQNTTSVLFFVGVGVGVLVGCIIAATAPLAVIFFGEPRLIYVIPAMAVTVPVGMIATQHIALMTRGMRWADLQIGALLAVSLSVLVAIVLAVFTPLGYWALVAQSWANTLVFTVYILIRCDWRPSIPTNWRAARSSIFLGLNLTGFTVLNYFHRSLDQVLIGWRWGTIELGYYARAYALLSAPINFVNGPISSAMQPALSRLQDRPAEWRRAYLDGLGAVVLIGGGITSILFGGADALIEVVFGPGWGPTKSIFSWLALSMLLGGPMSSVAWIYISLGRTNRMFHWGLMSCPVYVAAFVIGLPYGGVGVAIAYSTAIFLLFLPCFIMATRDTALSVKDVIAVIWPVSAAAMTIGILLRMATRNVDAFTGVLMSMAAGMAYLVIAVGLVLALPAYASIRVYCLGMLDKLRRRFERFGSTTRD